MTLVISNTLTRRKEPFHTIEPGRVRMYVCGPTVYADAHIGHAMSAIVFDVVRRGCGFGRDDAEAAVEASQGAAARRTQHRRGTRSEK